MYRAIPYLFIFLMVVTSIIINEKDENLVEPKKIDPIFEAGSKFKDGGSRGCYKIVDSNNVDNNCEFYSSQGAMFGCQNEVCSWYIIVNRPITCKLISPDIIIEDLLIKIDCPRA